MLVAIGNQFNVLNGKQKNVSLFRKMFRWELSLKLIKVHLAKGEFYLCSYALLCILTTHVVFYLFVVGVLISLCVGLVPLCTSFGRLEKRVPENCSRLTAYKERTISPH